MLYSFRAGGDHAPTFVSPNIARLFGYEPREYLEHPGFWRERVHPDDLPRAEAGFARLLEAGRHACEYRFRRKDGTYRWVEDRQRLVRAPDGGPDEVVGSWTDVDDRERAEAGRRDAERRLRDAVEGMPEPAVLYDAEDRLVVCNRRYAEAFFPGRGGPAPSRRPLPGAARRLRPGRPPRGARGRDRRTGRRASWSAAAPGEPFEVALADGRRFRVTERRAREGGTISVLAEVTELRAKEAALDEARARLEARNRELRRGVGAGRGGGPGQAEFLAAMSHEIRTPLTAVLGMADLLAAEPLDARQRGYVEAIRTSGRHLLAVVNDVLDFSRIEAGRLELERVDFSVPEVLERVRSLLAPQARERGLRLDFELDEHSPPVVRGDPTRLQQVLINLAGNGLKFTHAGGVTVAASSRPEGDGAVAVPVRGPRHRDRDDAGGGGAAVPALQPGGPVDGAALRRQRARAGDLQAAGRGHGRRDRGGQRARRGQPVLVRGAAGARGRGGGQERAAFDPAQVRPLRLLVAEDVELNRDLLGEVLGRHGHAAVFAENGAEAVERAAGRRLRPGADGRADAGDGRGGGDPPHPGAGRAGGRVPIVALTANVMAGERERYLAAGMDGCLTKPVDWGELFAALARHGGPGRAAGGGDRLARDRGRPAGAPLVDRAMLDGLAVRLPAEAFAGLVRRGIGNAERACGRLGTLPAGSEELAREAHSLKGTSGSFGLRRVSAVAGEIEEAAKAGEDVSGLVARLKEEVAATRGSCARPGCWTSLGPAEA